LDPGATLVLVNEHDAGSFESPPHNFQRRATGFVCAGFYLSDSHDTNPGPIVDRGHEGQPSLNQPFEANGVR
jgi:hypothetical protein